MATQHDATVMSSPTATTTAVAASPPVVANDLDVIQDMIDISADRLEGLRTQCATSATLTQQEIRSLETKLVRMFSELLLTKARLCERIPASGLPHSSGSELRQWLRVVGLSAESLHVCLTRLSTLEQLLAQSDDELRQLLSHNPSHREEEVRRLTRAMQNLRKCREALAADSAKVEVVATTATGDNKEAISEQLFWDSWDRHHHHHHHHHHHNQPQQLLQHRGSVGNIGSVNASPRAHRMLPKHSRQSPAHEGSSQCVALVDAVAAAAANAQGSTLTLTLTPSPPNSPFVASFSQLNYNLSSGGSGSLNGTPAKSAPRSKAGTPPPMKKHQTLLSNAAPLTPTHSNTAQLLQHQQLDSAALPIAKSKSHESQFHEASLSLSTASSPPSASVTASASSNASCCSSGGTRSRLHTDPSPDSYSSASSDIFIEHTTNSLQVPRSPCTPLVSLGMGHTISHRFTKVFKMMATCDLCQKQMFFGLKCRECKYRCHKDCEPNVPPSCGLPREFVDEFKKTLKDQASVGYAASAVNTSPNLSGKARGVARHGGVRQAPQPDSSSPGSSCNSSSPSSPALFQLQQQQQMHQQQQQQQTHVHNIMSSSTCSSSSNLLPTPAAFHKHASQFNFPDVTITSNCNQSAGGGGVTTQMLLSSQSSGGGGLEQCDAYLANDAPATTAAISATAAATTSTANNSCNVSLISASGTICSSVAISSTTSETFYRRKLSAAGVDVRRNELADTHKSNDSDKTLSSLSGSTTASTDSDRTPVRLDSTEDGDSGQWPRQNSLSLKEWDIPYGDLHLLEKIGKGRFGTVHRALWHGDVAVKLLKEDYLDDEETLEAFKLEVANFKKTRHENLVLFMGACMNPPYLAIVTSLCKGNTLYTYIHARRDKFTINRTTLVAQQISQGMGYLHARGIHHKDLRTKNIFLENGKVIITDFGLFSSTKLLYCDEVGLGVPNGWLCYLAPELMRALAPRKPPDEILPFSKASDVYSFGTVWYELLCGEFPFKLQPPESMIWLVGRGMKQTLANLQTSRDVKDILMLCWSFQAVDRPDFAKLLTLLERLPKKRLARSPSHPVQLSRSAESVF